jgi:hypothetical protein
MPNLKLDDEDLDIDALEGAEYNEDDYQDYDGPQPPAGTRLTGYIKKIWWAYSQAGNGMLVILFLCNEGKYDGMPVWERIPIQNNTKFRWKPFLDVTGITLREIKNKMNVQEEDDNIGCPINAIGKWKPGEDQEIDIITKRERYEGEWSTKVNKFLPTAALDPDDDDDDDDEPEPAPAPKPRTRRTAAKTSKKPDPEPEPEEEDEEEDDAEEPEDEEEPAKPAAKPKARRAPAKPAQPKPATAKAGRRGARKPVETGYDEEPPF